MPFVILPTNSASGGYDVTNSLRFNSGSSDSLSRTPASATNRRTWTWSGWVKKCKILPDYPALFSASNSIPDTVLRFDGANDRLNAILENGGGGSSTLVTTQVFRDLSAWYHIVWAVDTTLATANNRQRLYINGTEVTDFASRTNPSQNLDTEVNNTVTTRIGTHRYGSFSDFYLSEVYLIDGQQLTPSSFGETDTDTGIWKPKAYTGTYGTNGFYLQFKNSASLGTDSSGNGNTFTVNNLTSVDQSTDTPTNNFSTVNSIWATASAPTFSQGNLVVTPSVANYQNTINTFGISTGKFYAEMLCTGTPNSANYFGIGNETEINYLVTTSGIFGDTAGGYSIRMQTGDKRNNSTNSAYGSGFASGDIMQFAFDITNGKVWFGKNGTFFASGDPASGTNPAFTGLTGTFFIGGTSYSGGFTNVSFNFGSPNYSANSYTDGAGFGNFSYAVPSGYYSLNTKNLATFG
jgi:hypothetical protein